MILGKLAKKSHRLMNRDEFEGELKEGCYITVTDEVIRNSLTRNEFVAMGSLF